MSRFNSVLWKWHAQLNTGAPMGYYFSISDIAWTVWWPAFILLFVLCSLALPIFGLDFWNYGYIGFLVSWCVALYVVFLLGKNDEWHDLESEVWQ